MNAFISDFASKLWRLPKQKEPAFQHPHYLFVQKKSQHCCWKCSAHEGIVFIDCIFTSPEASQSHVLPNASQPFALAAFYSNTSFTARTSSPFHLPCSGVQHSWSAAFLKCSTMMGLCLQVCEGLNQSKTSLWHASAHPTHAFPFSPSPVLGVIHFSANLACHPQQHLLPAAAHSATTEATV